MNVLQHGEFPLKDVLRDLLYYPASGTDGDPVQELPRLDEVGGINSFIYADYAVGEKEVRRQLLDPEDGFKGYRVVFTKSLPETALAPQGWLTLRIGHRDGDPTRYEYAFKLSFILWVVLERDGSPVHRETWGPERFSFLFLGKDGVETYQNIFIQNHCCPKILAVIQPGFAFGHNRTDFRDQRCVLLRTLCQNPAGLPKFLLEGTYRGHMRDAGWMWPMLYSIAHRTWATKAHGLTLRRLSRDVPVAARNFSSTTFEGQDLALRLGEHQA